MAHSTQVLPCDPTSIHFDPSGVPTVTCQKTLEALQRAAHHLNAFQTVAFPTETVYGLGALAMEPTAAARIFSTKGRPPDNPLIVHVSSMAMLQGLLPQDYSIPKTSAILMKHFWPGALTLLFPCDSSKIPPIITANQPTVAIRMPSHPVARALIAITDAPVAAPSANSSGKPSPTRAKHVLRDLGGKVGIILDGGPCEVGLESTVVDATQQDGNIRILRPGGVTAEDIERVLKQELAGSTEVPKVLVHRRDYSDEAQEEHPTTPGMKYRHYSPTVPVILLYTSTSPHPGAQRLIPRDFLATLKGKVLSPSQGDVPLRVGLMTPSDSALASKMMQSQDIRWERFDLGPVADPAVSAQRLFDGLLTLDGTGVDLILVEAIEEEREGLAVMNRAKKAAGESVWLDLDR